MISESLVLFGLSSPCVTCDTSSLINSEPLWDVCAVEYMSQIGQQFVDDFCVLMERVGLESISHM